MANGRAERSVCTRWFRRRLDDLEARAQEAARQAFVSWRDQGFPLPCGSPTIKQEKRVKGIQIYGCYITFFYRAFMVFRDGEARWYWIGNHPDRGYVPPPPTELVR